MKKIFLLVLLIILANQITEASGGSSYTRYGVGDIRLSLSARQIGIGGLGFALSDQSTLDYNNPANWYQINLTRFQTGLSYSNIKIEDQNTSSTFNQTVFSGFVFGVPVQKDLGISIVGGIIPFANVDYQVEEDLNNPLLGGNYKQRFEGDGGLNKLFLGASYKLPYDFVFGFSYEYYLGKISYNTVLDVPTTNNISKTEFLTEKKYNGSGVKFGLLTPNLSELFNSELITDWRIGAAFNLSSNINTDTSITKKSSTTTTNIVTGVVETKIPMSIGVGTSIKINKKYLFLADYFFQPWKKYEVNGVKSPYLRDYQKISFGFEYQAKTSRFDDFWEQISFRGGLSFEQTQYKINNEGIDQVSVHGGFSVPISQTNMIDIGLQYGIRGTTDFSLLKESFIKTVVSISFGELWFQRVER